MTTENLIETVTEKIQGLMADPKHFLVEVRIKPTNNIKVFIDGDEGIPLSDLVSYNRKLYKALEESALFPEGDFSLEVSSPGIDEPLKLHRQYGKNVGRYVELTLNDDPATKIEGKLLAATEDGIVLETESGKGKKKEVKQETILFSDIKTTKVQVKF
ncbi:ribosome maturation factor RimP [Flaviaesturariibacter aridisoli]|uniref:Ribosome maturation factor RimP n=1 Tax=Flaviaesturariibacter aridisoli TaxID=2545761 RepID=A0A4R4DXH6_9BACT|nr:ribosome maturation factor [Flaviaesturariibacter aridisoli]TCZ69639.1 ribosome maturation factor [Flaviaesturariibacter aridisoli]